MYARHIPTNHLQWHSATPIPPPNLGWNQIKSTLPTWLPFKLKRILQGDLFPLVASQYETSFQKSQVLFPKSPYMFLESFPKKNCGNLWTSRLFEGEGTMRPCDLCLLPPGPEDLALSDACAMSGVDPWMEHCSDQRGDGRRWSVSASRWGGAAWELRIPWQAMRWEFLKQSLCKKGAHIRRHYDVLASWCCRTEQMLRQLRVIAS